MTPFKLVIPYYENPGMLVRQIAVWNLYAGALREAVQVILVDDGSPRFPAAEVIAAYPCKLKLRLWRIAENIPWNQHGARNLGAKVAGEGGWLLMTDIDHLLMPDQALCLAEKALDPARHYTFARTSLPELAPYKPHPNSFLVTRAAYWEVGGYDEDYCGSYGGDGRFTSQLSALVPEEALHVKLVRVPREVQPDASTTEWPRTGELKDRFRSLFEAKRAAGDEKARNPLRFTWERVL